MAEHDAEELAPDLDDELEQYLTDDESGWAREFVMAQVRRSPWWAISFLVHVLALLIMYKWPYRVIAEEQLSRNIEVAIKEPLPDEDVQEPEPPPEPEVEPDLDVPIEDIPITPEPPTKEDPGPDLDLPPVDDVVTDDMRPIPSIDPPSATPVLAVREKGRGVRRGIYSGRNSRGRANALGGGGGTSQRAESAVNAGLLWLAKAQARDGRWDCKKWDGGGNYDVGMTGMALLAFLGAGFTHTKGRYKSTVSRGLSWLAANQKPNGAFAYKTFYEMGIAGMAVGEAYGLTRSPKVGRMAQKAVDFIIKTQPEHGGFRYGGAVPKNEGDTSVTGWQIMAIKSAICSELKVPEAAVERSRVFLKNSYRDYGKTCYTVGGGAGSPAMWSVGMVCRQFLGGEGYDDEIRQAADTLLTHAKGAKGGRGDQRGRGGLVGDLYYTYYAVLGMYQMGGEYWVQWNKLFREPLVKAQVHKLHDRKGRFIRGSWDPENHRLGSRGGRVYCTAMAILSLEVYYRFLPVYKANK